jgi:nucleotide-binding universal stress UspA family protein
MGDLERSGRTLERMILRGHPAKAILAEAREFEADLIVVGSRGHGAVRTALLGSVSADVVDHAPCPVLVARHEAISRILVATDGSAGAEHAEHVLRDWPILAGRPVTVLCVADVGLPVSTGMAPAVDDRVFESYALAVDEARQQARDQAAVVAERLAAVGFDALPETREGVPAEEILAVAASRGADLIVVGTRGHTGLARLVLGSVARTVLTHAQASVLVVREKARIEPVEPPEHAVKPSAVG